MRLLSRLVALVVELDGVGPELRSSFHRQFEWHTTQHSVVFLAVTRLRVASWTSERGAAGERPPLPDRGHQAETRRRRTGLIQLRNGIQPESAARLETLDQDFMNSG